LILENLKYRFWGFYKGTIFTSNFGKTGKFTRGNVHRQHDKIRGYFEDGGK
jgi:hypothetical protein